MTTEATQEKSNPEIVLDFIKDNPRLTTYQIKTKLSERGLISGFTKFTVPRFIYYLFAGKFIAAYPNRKGNREFEYVMPFDAKIYQAVTNKSKPTYSGGKKESIEWHQSLGWNKPNESNTVKKEIESEIQYEVPIRYGAPFAFSLPKNMTKAEADRLANFIKSLPF